MAEQIAKKLEGVVIIKEILTIIAIVSVTMITVMTMGKIYVNIDPFIAMAKDYYNEKSVANAQMNELYEDYFNE